MGTVSPRYRDRSAPLGERVADLLERMTREEKIAQLGSLWAFEVVGPDGVDRERLAALVGDGIGQITRLAGSTNLGPVAVAEACDAIQRFFVEETRLGIPVIIHEECLHGLVAMEAPVFQQSIGAAASFDAATVSAVASTIRRRMLLTGARQALGPVFDISRDPRWGRVEETYGEDPYLAAALGCAYVAALQGDDLATGVLATGKHMVGHGLAEGGLNTAPVHIGWRELRDEQLLPFEAAVRETGLASIMPAYCDVDGVACHASRELLETILRSEWGFDGIVVSDYLALEMLSDYHRLTPDLCEAARLGLAAGVDSELPRTKVYGDPLAGGLESGRIDEALLDAAVGRMLRMKFRLGLFERPGLTPPAVEALAGLAVDETQAARDLARKSLVLVTNDGTLPLRQDVARIAVIGPIADSARDLQGDYSHLVHMQTLRELRAGENAFGVGDRAAAPADELAGHRTILDAIGEVWPAAAVQHARGSGLSDGTDAELAEAVTAAGDAEVAIVVLGERSGLTDDSTTGEFRDRLELGFSGRQQELLEAVVATGTLVVLVVVSGRPLAIPWAAEHCAAILLAWVPGDAGPDAIAGTLRGDLAPGGKLPVTVPHSVGQVPLTYRHHPSGGRSHPKGDYVDGPSSPLWPFGFGLSYTTFVLADARLDRAAIPTDGGEVTLRVDVTNTGSCAGDEVVQVYARDEEASVARPVRELIGFHRVTLAPGECRTVSFTIAAEQLAFTNVDYRRVVEPGHVTLGVGTSSADVPLSVTLELTGDVADATVRHRYLTRTSVD